jgi:GGDEF domain-containing protein
MERRNWPVTFSIGALTCCTPPDNVDHLIALADNLMYEVKHGSRNAVAYSVR